MKWVAMPIAQGIVSAGDQALAILRGLGETGWQDIHAMYDLGASDGKRGPSWQDI